MQPWRRKSPSPTVTKPATRAVITTYDGSSDESYSSESDLDTPANDDNEAVEEVQGRRYPERIRVQREVPGVIPWDQIPEDQIP